MLASLKKHWNKLVVFAAAVMAILSRFLVVPPFGLEQQAWFRFGVYAVALLTGLWLIPMKVWSARKNVAAWWVTAAALAASSVLALTYYTSLINRWTIPYYRNERVVIGQHLTPDAEAYGRELPGGLNDTLSLLRKYDGDASAIWPEKEITSTEDRLLAWYLVALVLLASAPIAVGQSFYCLGSRRKSEARKPNVHSKDGSQ